MTVKHNISYKILESLFEIYFLDLFYRICELFGIT